MLQGRGATAARTSGLVLDLQQPSLEALEVPDNALQVGVPRFVFLPEGELLFGGC